MIIHYHAFGLHIRSGFELPALPLAGSGFCSGDQTVSIQHGEAIPDNGNGALQTARFVYAKPGHLWFQVPHIARFHVAHGRQITVMPEPGADAQSIRLYILGSAMGALLHQRGQLLLHGSALRFGGRAVVFAGRSGAGKSTLAAAFHQRGHEVLTDDVAVIDAKGMLQPGYPQLKLWRDCTKKLDIQSNGLSRIRLQVDKYAYPLREGFCRQALPVATVFVLNQHNKNQFLSEPLTGTAKFSALKNHTYRMKHLNGLGLSGQHLLSCGQFANRIHVIRVTRPNAGFDLDALTGLIEAELSAAQTAPEAVA